MGPFDPSEKNRCPICNWPMKNRAEDGCVPGNCCARPANTEQIGIAACMRLNGKQRDTIAQLEAGRDDLRMHVHDFLTHARRPVGEDSSLDATVQYGWLRKMEAAVFQSPSSFRPVPQAETGEIKVPDSTPREG